MMNIFTRYKKQCIILGIVLAVVIFAIYLRAMFLPGLWHIDAFLYRQDDGSFVGADSYAKYQMTVKPADYETRCDG